MPASKSERKPKSTVKPRLRGVLHAIASLVALVAGGVLIACTASARGRLAAGLYSASLVTLFGVSAGYHIPTWTPRARAWMRRLDHSAIFVLIAGTYLPFGMLLPPASGHKLLTIVGTSAALGILQSILWVQAPKPLIACIYVALGWIMVPFLPALRLITDGKQLALLCVGGGIYSLGAVVYAARKPDPAPAVFGYHEVFHALTIVAAACHFIAVIDAVLRMT